MGRERNDETVVSFRVFFSFFSFPSLSLSRRCTLVMRDLYGRRGEEGEFKLRKISRSRREIDEIDFLAVINISRGGGFENCRVLNQIYGERRLFILYSILSNFSIEMRTIR